ncbi:MAG: DUF1456 domain-containing protein [Pseudohongiella sp.]|nr:MAG: DUF1456 domain-containing protein [Pseudohongiella sp.]
MTNNDCLRRLRYILDFDDSKMIAIFALANVETDRAEVSSWLKQDDDADFKKCDDPSFAAFLNGLIVALRGAKDGEPPRVETTLNNNMIFMKLKIALSLQGDEILQILESAGQEISKHELSAFFRRPDHKHYRECKDQILRNFLTGLRISFRE